MSTVPDSLRRRINRVNEIHRLLTEGEGSIDDNELANTSGDHPLPPPRTELMFGLDQALARRRSHYRFDPTPPTLEDISTLLHWALGGQRTIRMPDNTHRRMAMAPSAGGLPSIDAYLLSQRREDLPGGVFRYESTNCRLAILRTGDPRHALRSALVQPEFAERAPLVIILVVRLDTTLGKYPERHYRTLHIDAGIAVQNLYLVSTALELAGCAVTGFNDNAITQLLQLPDTAFPTVAFPFGRAPTP